jgi:ABC-type branched-subunit amino acid transport system substrate-binding protein
MLTRTRRIAATLVALMLLTAACTSDPDEETGGGDVETDGTDATDGGGDGGEQPQGSTRGITDGTIKIGYIGNNFGALAEAGLAPDLGDQSKTIPAIVEEINENGGIAGRQIELDLQVVDFAAGPEAAQAACLAVTQDFQAAVVMVAAAVSRDTTRCVSVTNRTLTIGGTGFDDGVYEEAEGRLFTVATHTAMSTNRQFEAWGQLIHDDGALEGKTIGVVSSESSPEFVAAANDGLIPRLEELGYEVAENITLPCPPGDNDCEQHEAAVQRMKGAGVDFVFMNAPVLSGAAFIQAAKNLDFKPQWAANGNQVTDTVAQFYAGVSDWWDGAIGVSTVFADQDDLSDEAADCNEIVSSRSTESYEPGTDAYGFTALQCLLFMTLKEAADSVEGDLNEASIIQALEGIDETPMNAGPAGSLGPDKHDAGDYVFMADYSAEAGEFVRREGEAGEPFKVD